MDAEVTCPRCNSSMIVDNMDEESGAQDVACEGCGAVLEVGWSDQGASTEVEIIERPPVEFDCPVCDESQAFEGVDEESGTVELECDTCGAVLEVEWRNWVESLDVDVLEKPLEPYYKD
ncbi:MAG: hypothetical protein GY856_24005 [bacterium]|nr:hypothetical protein [bacterium]